MASVRRLGLAIAMTPGRFGAVQRLIGHGLKMLQQAADFTVFVLWQIGQAGLLGAQPHNGLFQQIQRVQYIAIEGQVEDHQGVASSGMSGFTFRCRSRFCSMMR